MDHLTGRTGSPTYEFAYSGHNSSPSYPNFNHDAIDLFPNIAPAVANLFDYPSSTFTVQNTSPMSSTLGNNTVVYRVPEHIPLETVLKQLGVDMNTLQRTSSDSNHYISSSVPIEWNFPSPSHHQKRRRRVVCYETTDSSSDDSARYSSGDDHYRRHHRRRHHRRHSLPPYNDEYNHQGHEYQPQGSAAQIHNLLGNVWRKTERAAHNQPQANNSANVNSQWQAMRNSRPSASPTAQATSNAWEAMRNSRPSAPPTAQATSNAWEAMRNSPPTTQATNNAWQAMRNSPPTTQATSNAWQAMRNSPPTAQATNNAWQAMHNAPGPMHSSEQQAVQNIWNRASNAADRKADLVSNAFNRMGQAPGQMIQPPPPQPTNQAAVNSFLAARHVPLGVNQPNSAVGNAWGRADNAVHNMPPPMSNPPWNRMSQPSQGSAVNSVWNHLQQNPAPFSNPPYPQPPTGGPAQNPPFFRPPMSGLQSGPNFTPAPTSFGSLLSQAHQQHSAFAGAAYPAGPSY